MGTKGINKLLIFIALIGFLSCDQAGVFDEFQTLDRVIWHREKPVNFEFAIADTLSPHHLFFAIRNNQQYAYSNLFLIAELNFPNGKKIVDTLEYQMADNRGRFLGKGFASAKESKLWYKENSVFPVGGNYTLSISQAMRKGGVVEGIKELKGITDVGFRIEKVN